MAGEERFSGADVAAVLNVNGAVSFAKSIKKSGGTIKRKDITDGNSGVVMEQDSRREPLEYQLTLMLPRLGVQDFKDEYKEGVVVTTFSNGIDSPAYLAEFGSFSITKADWDAAIMEDNVVELNVTIRSRGYGNPVTAGVGGGG